jgi:hypothetical protein
LAGVGSPGEDVDHRERQERLAATVQDLPQRAAKTVRAGNGQGDRQGQHGISAQTSEVGGAVEFFHDGVGAGAVNRVEPQHGGGQDLVEVADRVLGPITVVALLSVA